MNNTQENKTMEQILKEQKERPIGIKPIQRGPKEYPAPMRVYEEPY